MSTMHDTIEVQLTLIAGPIRIPPAPPGTRGSNVPSQPLSLMLHTHTYHEVSDQHRQSASCSFLKKGIDAVRYRKLAGGNSPLGNMIDEEET
jgi:hypothetical protein